MNNTAEPFEKSQAASHHQREEGFGRYLKYRRLSGRMALGWQAGNAQVSGLARSDRDRRLSHPGWPKDELPKVRSLQRLRADRAVAGGGSVPRVRPGAAAEAGCCRGS